MATEVFANNPTTTLNGAISSGATSLTLTSATLFPSAGNFRLLIDSEIFLVTAIAGAVCTVLPGQEGTTQAAHANLAAVALILTRDAIKVGLQQTRPRVSNTSNTVYTMDSTGGQADVLLIHNKSGNVAYVLPTPTDGRHAELKDQTGAIQTPANWVSLVPHAGEKINGSTGFAMTGTAYHFTNGSSAVSATGSKFTQELYVGCSIASSNQAGVNYIVQSITDDTHLTLGTPGGSTTNFSGTTTTTATATRTSLLFAANFGRLYIDSDGTDWLIKGDGTWTEITFNSSGTFIPCAGTTLGRTRGAGGGGGGGGGTGGQNSSSLTNNCAGAGGGGSNEYVLDVSWTGNTGLAVTVGAGGTGGPGSAANSKPGLTATSGGTSSLGSLAQFPGASAGAAIPFGGNINNPNQWTCGGASCTGNATGGSATNDIYVSNSCQMNSFTLGCWSTGLNFGMVAPSGTAPIAGGPGNGGDSGVTTSSNVTASPGVTGNSNAGRGTFTGGTGGGGGGVGSTTVAGGPGGGGGGAGPAGQGGGGGGGGGGTSTSTHGTNGAAGTGGTGASGGSSGATGVGGAGGNGGSAAANTGAGGGGGGAGANGSTTGGAGGNGGNGGSGYVVVSYVL